ncbi:5'-deoxynucleotidase [Paenibacillus mendelii]|uniref:5'-deoxynucleotidase n=1 Tax=Paenibacillus mendelii TaxID=206163 RepID=A0ABV6J958_9BACL|nr:5'-deoxynucleotidase [Paenibacillus mendelii]MCQ6559758.1 5'-deoxynucleotidase [Paenibacillus mendelii]
MDSHFIAYMYRLRYIERWSLMRNTTRENVAEHSYHVALLAHMLCEIGNRVYGRSLNADRAASMALFHDATEVFTGDIPTPVKHHNPKMLANFREIESMAAERLLGMVPEPLLPAYEPLVLGPAANPHNRQDQTAGQHTGSQKPLAADGQPAHEPKHDSQCAAKPAGSDDDHELMKMLKAADLLDAYIKCLSELSSGNREFAVAKGQTEETLARLAIPEVNWFLTHMAPSFSKTLDELSEND